MRCQLIQIEVDLLTTVGGFWSVVRWVRADDRTAAADRGLDSITTAGLMETVGWRQRAS